MLRLRVLKSDLKNLFENLKCIARYPRNAIRGWLGSTYGTQLSVRLFEGKVDCWYVGDDGRGNWPWIQFYIQLYVISISIMIDRQRKEY